MSDVLTLRPEPPKDVVTIVVDKNGPNGDVSLTYDQFYITHDRQVWHLEHWLGRMRVVGLDLETGGLDHKTKWLATIQVGNPLVPFDGGLPRAYVIDWRCLSASVRQRLALAFADPKLLKLGQNIKFELLWIGEHEGIIIENVADTQITEQTIRAGLLNASDEGKGRGGDDGEDAVDRAVFKHSSMAHLARIYLGLELDKGLDVRLSFWVTAPGAHNLRQRTYAAGDVIYPFYIHQYQYQEMQDRALTNIVRIEWALIPCIAESELRGIAIDEIGWRKLWQESVAKEQEAIRGLDNLMLDMQGDLFTSTGKRDPNVRPIYQKSPRSKPVPLNWDSTTQVRWAIAEYCRHIGWNYEIVYTEKRLNELKFQYGKDWWEKQLARKAKKKQPQTDLDAAMMAAAELTQTSPSDLWSPLLAEQAPEYVIPEEEYCLLMTKDRPTLVLRKIRKQLPGNVVDLLVDYSKHHKRVIGFGNAWLTKHVKNGVLYVSFHQGVTATGRMSSEPNSQNIPNDPRYRACFRPRPGYVFVTLDYSQIEPRLSAEASGDETYRATFREADDIYCRVAQTMTGDYPNKHDPEGSKRRKAFKIVVLSMAYRMGAGKLRDRLTIELKEDVSIEYARELWSGFLEKHEKIKEYQNKCEHDALHKHPVYDANGGLDHYVDNPRRIWDRFLQEPVTWVEGPCGRKRFFRASSKGVYTEAPNAPIQGSSASVTKAAAVMVRNYIRKQGIDAFVVNYVHDELVWEVRVDQAKAFAVEAKRICEDAGRFWIKSVPVVAEYPEGAPDGITMFWAKEIKGGHNQAAAA